MKLKSVFIRFYKSFNYDYIRKITEGVERKPWETVKNQFYPFIEIPIDSRITTVVGANESGKSHLLSAIEKGITGYSTAQGLKSPIASADMCRYSHFFTATREGLQLPDFGFCWQVEDETDRGAVRQACSIPEAQRFDCFYLFRTGGRELNVYIPKEGGKEFNEFSVAETPEKWLPHVFRIESSIALPDSVSLNTLLQGRLTILNQWPSSERAYAGQMVEAGPKLYDSLGRLPGPSTKAGQNSVSINGEHYDELMELRSALEPVYEDLRSEEVHRKTAEFNLAYDLIFKIAGIEKESLHLLRQAIASGDTGIVRTIEEKINAALVTHLNFSRIWTQDRDFSLQVKATGFDLDFIISDRTGGHYTFNERSSGLKHFLSYYIQYLVHKSQGRSEILLMDEPDAFLSGEAQQDLLRVFEMFADPQLAPHGVEERVPVQVIYVTHSPFLVDKNHSERVRALEKAEGTKGTRVIAGTAQNRYEPLRSAFGAFVGETTFMSRCNLIVEGPADQILLAGAASYLRKLQDIPESQMLDLNRITIVPAGGGTSVPYMVYLARGRDTEKPAVIVLLDSDSEGNNARQEMGKTGPHPESSAVIAPNFILQLGEVAVSAPEPEVDNGEEASKQFEVLEDLVPLPLAVRAVQQFMKDVYRIDEDALSALTEKRVAETMEEMRREAETKGTTVKGPIFSALVHIVKEWDSSRAMNLGKVAFARTVVDLLPLLRMEQSQSDNGEATGLHDFEANMKALYSRLHQMQREAEREVQDKQMRQKIEEKVKTFLNDFGPGSNPARDDAARLLLDIEADLQGDDREATFVRQEIVQLRAAHVLTEDLTEPISDFAAFRDGLERLRDAKRIVSQSSTVPVLPRKEKSRVLPQAPAHPKASTDIAGEQADISTKGGLDVSGADIVEGSPASTNGKASRSSKASAP